MTPDIELVIEELTLEGFERRGRDAIGQAIQAELTRLLSHSDAASSFEASRDITQVNLGNVQVSQCASPTAVGSHVAQAVYRGLGR